MGVNLFLLGSNTTFRILTGPPVLRSRQGRDAANSVKSNGFARADTCRAEPLGADVLFAAVTKLEKAQETKDSLDMIIHRPLSYAGRLRTPITPLT